MPRRRDRRFARRVFLHAAAYAERRGGPIGNGGTASGSNSLIKGSATMNGNDQDSGAIREGEPSYFGNGSRGGDTWPRSQAKTKTWPWHVIGLIAVVICLFLSLGLWKLSHRGVTKENFERIQAGMTVDEVNFLLFSCGKMRIGGEGVCPWTWEAAGDQIYIHFDQQTGRATEAFFTTKNGMKITRILAPPHK